MKFSERDAMRRANPPWRSLPVPTTLEGLLVAINDTSSAYDMFNSMQGAPRAYMEVPVRDISGSGWRLERWVYTVVAFAAPIDSTLNYGREKAESGVCREFWGMFVTAREHLSRVMDGSPAIVWRRSAKLEVIPKGGDNDTGRDILRISMRLAIPGFDISAYGWDCWGPYKGGNPVDDVAYAADRAIKLMRDNPPPEEDAYLCNLLASVTNKVLDPKSSTGDGVALYSTAHPAFGGLHSKKEQ